MHPYFKPVKQGYGQSLTFGADFFGRGACALEVFFKGVECGNVFYGLTG